MAGKWQLPNARCMAGWTLGRPRVRDDAILLLKLQVLSLSYRWGSDEG